MRAILLVAGVAAFVTSGACSSGSKAPETGTPQQNGSTDGGSTDGGSTDGGSTDGGSTDGVGTASGSSSGGSSSGGSRDGAVGAGGPVPMIEGCPIFPADNPWNTRIDDATRFPVHPQWVTYQAKMNLTNHVHPDWGNWSTDHYGIPWQTVPSTQPAVPMTFDYAGQSDPGPYPLPASAKVEGGAGSGGDMHVLVVVTGACSLYETWSSKYVAPGWSCGSGAKFDLSSNALRPDGWTSADAAGLPILPGLVKVLEVQAGAVNHAIRFTMGSTQQAYIHPAVHAAGKSDPTLPPMGLRLRLKASFDTTPFTGATRVVLVAMQRYGIILADNGSDWYLGGDSDDAWTPWMDALVSDLAKVHGSDFEAVNTGPTSTVGL